MGWRRIKLAGVLLVLFATARSSADTVGGTIPPGSSNSNIAMEVELNWHLPDYACSRTGNTLTVTRNPGPQEGSGLPCFGRKLTATFRVTGGPTAPVTSVAHPFAYTVVCGPDGRLQQSIGFDEFVGSPTPLPPGQSTVFVIDGTGSPFLGSADELTIDSTESGLPEPAIDNSAPVAIGAVPALGEWGGIALGLALAGVGVFLIARRKGSSAPLA